MCIKFTPLIHSLIDIFACGLQFEISNITRLQQASDISRQLLKSGAFTKGSVEDPGNGHPCSHMTTPWASSLKVPVIFPAVLSKVEPYSLFPNLFLSTSQAASLSPEFHLLPFRSFPGNN